MCQSERKQQNANLYFITALFNLISRKNQLPSSPDKNRCRAMTHEIKQNQDDNSQKCVPVQNHRFLRASHHLCHI
jgi:hypothetical protein